MDKKRKDKSSEGRGKSKDTKDSVAKSSKPKSRESSQSKIRSSSKDTKKDVEKSPKKAVKTATASQPKTSTKPKESTSDRNRSKEKVKVKEEPKTSSRSKDKTKSSTKSEEKPKSKPKDAEKPKEHKSRSSEKPKKETKEKDKDKKKTSSKDLKDKEKDKSKTKEKDKSKSSKKSETKTEKDFVPNGIKQPEKRKSQEIAETSENPKDEEDDYDYEDDFEDYEEDFEEEEEDEVEEDKPTSSSATKETEESSDTDSESESEKQDILPEPQKPQPKKEKEPEPPRKLQRRPSTLTIDFSRATATDVQLGALGKVRRRYLELQKLIELDKVGYDIVELAPIRDYEYYIQTFGKGNRIQVQVQTRDDAVEREIQTEEIDDESKWTQHPATDLFGCGGDEKKKTFEEQEEVRFNSEAFNSLRFRRFIENTGQLICDLLTEGSTEEGFKSAMPPNAKFSDGYSDFSLGKLAEKSRVSAVAFCPSQPNLLLTSFYVDESLAEDLVAKGVVCLWSLNTNQQPLQLLLCENVPNCCCFNPDRASVVFAGLDDGSVVAWDLQESESLHRTIPWMDTEKALRTPTYDTAFLNGGNSNEPDYCSPVRAIATMGESDQTSSSYQLASLEERGLVHIWTVLETVSSAVEAMSEFDLGLSPGGKLKLVKSATVQPSGQAIKTLSGRQMQCLCMAQQGAGKSNFYIGTDSGFILHLARQDKADGPKYFTSDLDAPADVLSLAFNHFDSNVLLSGSSDGSARLYVTSYSQPISIYRLNDRHLPVTSVQWSCLSPLIFYTVHGKNLFAIWSLKDQRQIIEHQFNENIVQITENAAENNRARLAFAFENGVTQVHKMQALEGSSKFENAADLGPVLGI